MNKSGLLVFLAVTAVASVSHASLGEQPVVFAAGNWNVHRGIDTMTDKVTCTAIYKDDFSIQLVEDRLYLRIRGGLKGITMRFGEQPAETLRLPTAAEKGVSAVVVQDDEFRKLLGSARLRVQVLTVLDHLETRDLNLTGIGDAVNNIAKGCPGAPQAPSAAVASLCSDLVIARMKKRAIPEGDITEICAKR